MVRLTWIPLAQLLGGRAHLAVHDALVLLLLRVGLQALPRKAAPDEVHKHVPEKNETERNQQGWRMRKKTLHIRLNLTSHGRLCPWPSTQAHIIPGTRQNTPKAGEEKKKREKHQTKFVRPWGHYIARRIAPDDRQHVPEPMQSKARGGGRGIYPPREFRPSLRLCSLSMWVLMVGYRDNLSATPYSIPRHAKIKHHYNKKQTTKHPRHKTKNKRKF